jgi:hypothetical protein
MGVPFLNQGVDCRVFKVLFGNKKKVEAALGGRAVLDLNAAPVRWNRFNESSWDFPGCFLLRRRTCQNRDDWRQQLARSHLGKHQLWGG